MISFQGSSWKKIEGQRNKKNCKKLERKGMKEKTVQKKQ